jgi:cysteine desulfurase
MERIYLDHNATTLPLPEVVQVVRDTLSRRLFGNPASLHAEGRAAHAVVELARARVAALVQALPEEIVFVSGGSEADALAVQTLALRDASRAHVVVTAIEHRAVLSACRTLEQQGLRITLVPPEPDGIVAPAAVAAALTDQTGLVAVMLANNDTGALQPVADIAACAHARGAYVHVDAVQAAGRIPVDFRASGADTCALSAHKLYGPKGTGALVARQQPRFGLPPVTLPEFRHAGTTNVPGVAGFGLACEIASERLSPRMQHDRQLRDRLEVGLCQTVPGLRINGHREQRLPNTLNVSFRETDGAALAAALDRRGIAVATGAACGAGAPSHVLRAMGLAVAQIAGSLRFSVGETNTADEIDRTIRAVGEALKELQRGED